VDAIRALNEGRCVMAGFHTLQHPASRSLAERTYKPLLQPGLHKIIGFAQRTQGLMVARGNPLGLHTWPMWRAPAPLCQPPAGHRHPRAAGRPAGQGRALDPRSDITGYELTRALAHRAVAQAVAAGPPDVGLGIELAARARRGWTLCRWCTSATTWCA
jgi:putative molybdopterin biosynthesis protein